MNPSENDQQHRPDRVIHECSQECFSRLTFALSRATDTLRKDLIIVLSCFIVETLSD